MRTVQPKVSKRTSVLTTLGTTLLRMRSPRMSIGAACVLAALVGCDRQFVVTSDVSYDASIGYPGLMDVYEPLADSTRTGRPAILAIHGGGWRSGEKEWAEQFAKELCPRGYVLFSVNYRRSTDPNGRWPAQIEDVQKALRYVRANAARFRVDPTRIASLGLSAGGHLATMVALRDDPMGPTGRVAIAVNLDGEHDMTMPPDQVMDDFDAILSGVMGHGAPWSSAELRDISTVAFARPDVAVLTVHGASDDNVYVAQGERITAVLQAKGAETQFLRIDGAEGRCHEDCWKVPRARAALHAFLDRHLAHDGEEFARAAARSHR